MGRHRHVDRWVPSDLHLLADCVIVRPIRLQVYVISIHPIDDVVVWITALADQAIALKPDVHIAWNQLGPILEIGFEDRLEGVGVCEFDDAGGFAERIARGDFLPG